MPKAMSNDSNDDAAPDWKIFNRDTEAGRLLSRLYGEKPSGRVSYPKQRRRRRVPGSSAATSNGNEEKAAAWKTTSVVHGWNKAAEEEKERERKENINRALSLAVPKVGRGRAASDCKTTSRDSHQIPRRKTALSCRNTIDEANEKARHYRPAATSNMDEEKERYMLSLSSVPPTNASRNKPTDGAVKSNRAKSNVAPCTLFEQIYQEILERRKHQLALEDLGCGEDTRQATAHEIRERLEHLKRLDSRRALDVVQKLMKIDSERRSHINTNSS